MSNLSPAAILHNTSGTEVGTGANPVRVDPTGTTTQPVSDGGGSLTVDATSLPLPTGAATAALQTQPGVDIGDVTVNNAAGAGAVNIQDGGNSITVDGPLTDAELRASAVPVSVASLPLPTGAATSANQATIIGHVDGLEALVATLATQATAAAIQAVLEAIRDTAGVKKITDALPAGTNNIGDVDVVSSALPTGASTLAEQQTQTASLQLLDDAIHATNAAFGKAVALAGQMDDASITDATENNVAPVRITAKRAIHSALHDAQGNAIDSTLESGLRRLAVTTPPGVSIVVGTQVPRDLSKLVLVKLKNGSAENLIVDGSTTPQDFVFNADATDDIQAGEVRLVITTQDFTLDGTKFGGTNALTNGLLIDITAEGYTFTVGNIKINEEFLFWNSPTGITLNNTGPKDVMSIGFHFGNAPILKAGTSDRVRIRVRDNLTGGGAGALNYMQAQFYGVKV